MNPMAVSENTIVQEVTIKAPAERVFDALTNPMELLKWWRSPGKFRVTHMDSDLRPGGKWLMRVEGNCGPGKEHAVGGVYREIVRPQLLVFTWIREEETEPETLVRFDLEEKNGATTVRVTHSSFISESHRARNSGWPTVLELLQTHLQQ